MWGFFKIRAYFLQEWLPLATDLSQEKKSYKKTTFRSIIMPEARSRLRATSVSTKMSGKATLKHARVFLLVTNQKWL